MCVPGGARLAVVAMMGLGLAADPIFALLALTAARRLGPANSTKRVVTYQVAASALAPRRSRPAQVWRSRYLVRMLWPRCFSSWHWQWALPTFTSARCRDRTRPNP